MSVLRSAPRRPPSSFSLRPSAFRFLPHCRRLPWNRHAARAAARADGRVRRQRVLRRGHGCGLDTLRGLWRLACRSYIVHRSSFIVSFSLLSPFSSRSSRFPAAMLVRPLLGVLPGETLSIPLLLLATFAVVFLPAASHGALFVVAAAHRTAGHRLRVRLGGHRNGARRCLPASSAQPLVVTGSGRAVGAIPLAVAAGFGHGRTRTKWTMWTLGFGVLASLVFALPIERMAWGAAWRGQRVMSVANSPYGKIVRLERARPAADPLRRPAGPDRTARPRSNASRNSRCCRSSAFPLRAACSCSAMTSQSRRRLPVSDRTSRS